MSWKDVTEGDKIGEAKSMRRIKSPAKGTDGIEIAFEFEEPSTGTMERLFWQQWITPNTIERCVNTLKNVLGWNGDEAVNENGHFSHPEVLDWGSKVRLVVEQENYTNKDGEEKSKMKIQWVNSLTAGSQFSDCSPEECRKPIPGLRAEFLKAGKGMKPKAAPKQELTEEAVPF